MKTVSWIVGFFIGGFLLGLMIGSGESNYIKKSQRGNFSIVVPLIFGVVFGIGGGILSTNMIKDDKKRSSLGLDKINTVKYKDGRKWVYQSEWINPTNNENYIVKTFYDKSIDSSITQLNGVVYTNHSSNSGSDLFISKVHSNTLRDITNTIMNTV
jgi:hypothetical protein